ncbi:MAG: hypothetical protein ABF751_12120, partial [Acetobacter orientalis]
MVEGSHGTQPRPLGGAAAVLGGRPLTSSMHAIAQPDLLAALEAWVAQQPGLAGQLAHRPWQADVKQALGAHHARLLPFLKTLTSAWGHGDWHGSNLFWQTSPAAVVATQKTLANTPHTSN